MPVTATVEDRPARAPRRDPARPARILIVEDNPALNRVLAGAFRAAGCEVVQGFDGLQAHDLARARRPGVILLDLDLPRLYGQVLLRSLRRDPATAASRVVVLTARPDLLRAEDRGLVFAVLLKPTGLDELVGTGRAAPRAP